MSAFAVVATAFALVMGTLFAPAAHAAEVDVITGVSSPVEEYLAANPFKVTVDFAVPEGAQSGDTFTVNFSDKVVGQQSSYSIYDANGEAIAECTTTDLANECTFTDYVDTRGDIQGSFDFVVIGQYATNGAGLDWSTGAGQSFHTDTNVRVTGWSFPGKLWKGAWVQNDGSIDYELSLRGSRLGDAGNVVTDSYDPRVVIDRSSFFVNEYVREDANDPSRVPHRVMGEDEYDVVFDDASNTFTVSIPGAVNDEYHAYQIRYSGLVDDSVVDGDVVSNTGTAGDQTASRDVIYHRPSGAGAGSIGNISWKKVDEEGNLLAGAEFQLEGPDGYSETIVDNGELDQDPKDGVFSVGKLAKGDYTLTETKAPEGYELDEDAVYVTLASGGQMTQSAGEIVNVKSDDESTPCVPCEGGNPEDPEKPEKPEKPENPDKPENPGDTDKPGDSDKPEKPGTPDNGGNANGGDGNDSPRGNGPGAHANTGGEVQETSGSTPWLLSGLLLAAGGALAMALVVRNRRNTADQS